MLDVLEAGAPGKKASEAPGATGRETYGCYEATQEVGRTAGHPKTQPDISTAKPEA